MTSTMEKVDRTGRNRVYQGYGKHFVLENAAAIPYAEQLYKAKGCLEQFGRWNNAIDYVVVGPDDRWEADYKEAINQAGIAAEALKNGNTVKQVEKYLRHGRLTGEWDENLLTSTITQEAATNTAQNLAGLTPADLIVIHSLLEVFGDESSKFANKLNAIHSGYYNTQVEAYNRAALTAEQYAHKVKTAYETLTGRRFPQNTGGADT